MGSGWVKVSRDVLDAFFWAKKPFSQSAAYIDLLLLANYKDTEGFSGGKPKTFRRGCVYKSQLELADRWGWERKRVKRFLVSLERTGYVTLDASTNGTTITLLKYDDFEDSWSTNGAGNDSRNGQQVATYKEREKIKKDMLNGCNPNQRDEYDTFV